MNKQIIHDALVLTAFTLVIGVILGAVYGITKAPIDKANEQTKKEAYQAVFADASGFNQQEYDADAADKMVADAGYDDTIDDVEQAVDKDGNALGYVITVTAKDGSQGSITFSVGIKNDGTVNGYSITDISETPGLGMKAEEEDFYSQFENKTVDKFTVVKQKPASDDQIEAITLRNSEIKRLENTSTTRVESPMPSPLIAEDVTASVGHIPSIRTKVGFSLITPLYKRSTYLFITEHLLTHSGSNRWQHYSHLPLPLK